MIKAFRRVKFTAVSGTEELSGYIGAEGRMNIRGGGDTGCNFYFVAVGGFWLSEEAEKYELEDGRIRIYCGERSYTFSILPWRKDHLIKTEASSDSESSWRFSFTVSTSSLRAFGSSAVFIMISPRTVFILYAVLLAVIAIVFEILLRKAEKERYSRNLT